MTGGKGTTAKTKPFISKETPKIALNPYSGVKAILGVSAFREQIGN